MQSAAIIKSIIEGDETATPEEVKRVLKAISMSREPMKGITTKQACSILGCTPCTLRRYEKNGYIAGVRYSARHVRWDETNIRHFAENGIDGSAL